MPGDSSSQLLRVRRGQAPCAKLSRAIDTRNICLTCRSDSSNFRLLTRWGFAVRLDHATACRGQITGPPLIEITVDAKAVALTVEEAAVPSMSAAILCIKEQLDFSAIRAHRLHHAVRESVVGWWQYAVKGVIQQLHSYNGAASVTCLRQLPAYVQAAKRGTHVKSACQSGVFAVQAGYAVSDQRHRRSVGQGDRVKPMRHCERSMCRIVLTARLFETAPSAIRRQSTTFLGLGVDSQGKDTHVGDL
jgi:hypothetical protein